MEHLDETRGARLQAALEAALKAKNPVLVRSIRAAMDGRVVDPLEGLSVHPEVDHLWNFPSE
jgi:hypothetical protein